MRRAARVDHGLISDAGVRESGSCCTRGSSGEAGGVDALHVKFEESLPWKAVLSSMPIPRLAWNRLLLVVAALGFREASKRGHLDDGRPLWKYSSLLG